MRRASILILILLLGTGVLSGCWDQEEITALASISGLGIDAGQRPGMLQLSVQIAAPTGASSLGGATESAKMRVLSIEAETIEEGIMQLQTQLRRSAFLLHLSFIVFGESIAKSGIDTVVAGLQGATQIRGSVPVFVAAGSAEAVLQAHSGIARSPGQDIANLLENIESAPIGNQTMIIDLLNILSSKGSELAIPILDLVPLRLASGTNLPDDGTGLSGEQYTEVVMHRTALFERDRWVATLDRMETNILVLLLGKSGAGICSTTNPANPIEPVSFLYESFNLSTKISTDGQQPPQILLKPRTTIRLLEAYGGYDLNTRGLDPLEQAIKFDIELQVGQLMQKLQELGIDALGLGQRIASRHPQAWSQLEPVWSEVYPQAEIQVEAQASVRSTGLIRKFFQTKRE